MENKSKSELETLIDYMYDRVRKEKKWGYIDRNGDEVIPCMYDSAEDFHEGLARVKRQDQVCLIDKNGREVLPQA